MDGKSYIYCPLARAKCNHGELSFTPRQEDALVCAFYDYENYYCHLTDMLKSLSLFSEVCNPSLGYLNIGGGIDTYEQN